MGWLGFILYCSWIISGALVGFSMSIGIAVSLYEKWIISIPTTPRERTKNILVLPAILLIIPIVVFIWTALNPVLLAIVAAVYIKTGRNLIKDTLPD